MKQPGLIIALIIVAFPQEAACGASHKTGRNDQQKAGTIAPTNNKVVLLTATGTQWGPIDCAFSQHAFSIKSYRGIAIWRDSEPDNMVRVNSENKSYYSSSILEYLGDVTHGVIFNRDPNVTTRPTKLYDGKPALEVTMSVPNRGQLVEIERVLTVSNVALPASMAKAWCRIMKTKPEYGFPVSSYAAGERRIGRHPEATPWKGLIEYRTLKLAPQQADRFVIPKEFKRARDKTSLWFSEDGEMKKQDMDQIFRSK